MTIVITIGICFLVICDFIVAAPYPAVLFRREEQNETDIDLKVGWVSTPNVRGTFDILLSSLTTLALCSWTAYHPNIKPRNTLWRSFWIRMAWMAMVVVVPELVLFIAWDQRAIAIEIRNYMNRKIDQEDAANAKNRNYRQNLTSSTTEADERSCTDQVEPIDNIEGGVATLLENTPVATSYSKVNNHYVKRQQGTSTSATSISEQDTSRDRSDPSYPSSTPSTGSMFSSSSWAWVSLHTGTSSQDSTGQPNEKDSLHDKGVDNASVHTLRESTFKRKLKGIFRIRKRKEKSKEKSVLSERHWTTEDAFFAAIGGYAVRSDSFWPSYRSTTLTFTPIGVIELARLGVLKKADSATVSDKSKADVVAKIIVCVQATWFLLQCAARKAQGLSITLLEVHVLAHVACAFIMYFLWFHKPYNVDHPIIMTEEKVVDLAALFAVAAPGEEDKVPSGPQRVARQAETVCMEQIEHAFNITARLNRIKTGLSDFIFNCCVTCNEKMIEEIEEEQQDRPEIQLLAEEAYLRANRALGLYEGMENLDTVEDYRNVHFSGKRREEDDIEVLQELTEPHVVVRSRNHEIGMVENLANVPRSRLRAGKKYTFTIISILYGAAHLTAWNSFFATPIEKWMWRVVSIEIAAVPLLLLIWHTIQLPAKGVPVSSWRSFKGVLLKLWAFSDILISGFLWFMLIAGYMYGRIYIFAQIFASLREVPADTYESVEWVNFIPHAG